MLNMVVYHRTLHKYINWNETKIQAHGLIVKGLTTGR